MADISQNPIWQQAQKVSADIGTNAAQIETARNAQADIANASADLRMNIGAADQIITGQKDQAELQTQNARLKAGLITGTDLSMQGEALSGLMDTLNTAYSQKLQAAQAIQEKRSVGFMDNPLLHIINQFTVNDDIDRYNAAETIESAAKEHITSLNSIAENSTRLQGQFTQAITQASIDANSKKIASAAEIESNKSRVESLGYNVDALKEAINAPIQQLTIGFQTLSAQQSQERIGMELANYKLHMEEFDWKRQEREISKEGDDLTIQRMQEGFNKMYGTNAPQLVNSPKVARDYLARLRSGANTPANKEAQIAYNMAMSDVIGGAPSQVIDYMRSNINFNLSPSQAPVKDILGSALQTTQAQALEKGVKDKTTFNEMLDANVRNTMEDYAKKIDPGSSNPLNIGSLKDILPMPGVADTVLAQKVLAPLVAKGATLDDPKQVWAAGITAVQSGDISLGDFTYGVRAVYTKGVATNLASRNFSKFGIQVTPEMMKYNTNIQVQPGAILGGTQAVDLTNPEMIAYRASQTLSSLSRQSFDPLFMGAKAADTLITNQINEPYSAGQTPNAQNRSSAYWERVRQTQRGNQ